VGIRLAPEKPLDHPNISSYGPRSNGGTSNTRQPADTSGVPHFGLLGPSEEDRKRRRLVLGISPFLEALAVGVMFWALASLPPSPSLTKVRQQVLYFHPVSPADIVKQPPRLLKQPVLPKLQRKEVQKTPEMARLNVPEISQPKIELPQTPPAPKPVEHFSSPEVPRAAPRPVAMPRVGTFNPGSMAKPTVRRPLHEVQTGGFGAEDGIPNNPADDSHNHVAQLGSFDLPSGPGHGNGTGGARGVPGTVASAGFGNGIGSGRGARANSAPETVQQSGFGSVVAGKATRTPVAARAAAFTPAVILSKPDPIYPPEARRLRIEGQVILNVLFGSSGNLRVLKVVQGLGHGMDQAAIEAAERIRFKPAGREGRPVDSTALVHIIFQLAY
jgi:TonB family protein